MNKYLTIENVDRELLRLMNENPDFKYSDIDNYPEQEEYCFYDRGKLNGPACDGCIFGQALQSLGVESVELCSHGIGAPINDVWRGFTGEEAPEYWTEIQRRQNEGTAWGGLRKLLFNNNLIL